MRNVGYALIGNLFIAVWGRVNVTDAEFPEVLAAFQRLDFDKVRMLIVTEGGGPTPVQRKVMNKVLDGKQLLTAVVTDDFVIRGTVTALSWFNKKIRSFPADALDEAVDYLGVPETKLEMIVQEVNRLRAELRKSRSRGVALGR